MHLEEIELSLLADNMITYIRGGQPFPIKDQMVNSLDFADCMVSVPTTHLCFCSMKTAMCCTVLSCSVMTLHKSMSMTMFQ